MGIWFSRSCKECNSIRESSCSFKSKTSTSELQRRVTCYLESIAVCSEALPSIRVQQLARPKSRSQYNEDYDPNAWKVSQGAKSAQATPRIRGGSRVVQVISRNHSNVSKPAFIISQVLYCSSRNHLSFLFYCLLWNKTNKNISLIFRIGFLFKEGLTKKDLPWKS